LKATDKKMRKNVLPFLAPAIQTPDCLQVATKHENFGGLKGEEKEGRREKEKMQQL